MQNDSGFIVEAMLPNFLVRYFEILRPDIVTRTDKSLILINELVSRPVVRTFEFGIRYMIIVFRQHLPATTSPVLLPPFSRHVLQLSID